MPHVVKERGQANHLPLLRGELSGEAVGHYTGKVHRPQHMLEPGVVRGWVNELGPGQLPYPPQSLNRDSVDDIPFDLSKSNVSVNRILDETPKSLTQTQPPLAVILRQPYCPHIQGQRLNLTQSAGVEWERVSTR